MHYFTRLVVAASFVLLANSSVAQSDSTDDVDELKITALEALISAPPERALPLVSKVLAGKHSDEVKERALFVLSQIDLPEAQSLLLDTARQGSGEMRLEAIRMIGIGGEPAALAGLSDMYRAGDSDVREAVLEAYLIADDSNAVYEIATSAENQEDFEEAVEILAVMDAREELRKLRNFAGMSESLIEAYAVSGDVETLREISMDGSNPEQQAQAIESLGIVGGAEVNPLLVEIYRGSNSPDVREAALHGLLIADHDEGVLELYQSSQDPAEKRELLEYLVMMDSEAIWDVIDSALEDQR
jgi:HEAT repeat protein